MPPETNSRIRPVLTLSQIQLILSKLDITSGNDDELTLITYLRGLIKKVATGEMKAMPSATPSPGKFSAAGLGLDTSPANTVKALVLPSQSQIEEANKIFALTQECVDKGIPVPESILIKTSPRLEAMKQELISEVSPSVPSTSSNPLDI
jgi:hypothetical protein